MRCSSWWSRGLRSRTSQRRWASRRTPRGIACGSGAKRSTKRCAGCALGTNARRGEEGSAVSTEVRAQPSDSRQPASNCWRAGSSVLATCSRALAHVPGATGAPPRRVAQACRSADRLRRRAARSPRAAGTAPRRAGPFSRRCWARFRALSPRRWQDPDRAGYAHRPSVNLPVRGSASACILLRRRSAFP